MKSNKEIGKGCQELPGIARSCQEIATAARNCKQMHCSYQLYVLLFINFAGSPGLRCLYAAELGLSSLDKLQHCRKGGNLGASAALNPKRYMFGWLPAMPGSGWE